MLNQSLQKFNSVSRNSKTVRANKLTMNLEFITNYVLRNSNIIDNGQENVE